jgi:V/A-type H+-transporting ATPase subunit E
MNGIEKIISHIESDAKNEIDKIYADAAAKCLEIEKQYDQQANDTYWKIIKDGTQEARLSVERLDSAAQLESKKQILACKQELIAKAFANAVTALTQLPEEKYVALLAKLSAQAAVSGSESIILSPADRTRCGKAVCIKANELLAAGGKNASLTLSAETRDIPGGVVVSSGAIEVNCSVDALVGQAKDELSAKVAAILFN